MRIKVVSEMFEKINTSVKIVLLEDNLDPDEYILKYGYDRFKNKIDNHPTLEIERNLTILIEHCLDPIREKFGKPITVTSGYRCEKLNKLVGGKPNSQHLKG